MQFFSPSAVLIAKTALDFIAAGCFASTLKPSMAVMFLGFAIADLGALWVSFK